MRSKLLTTISIVFCLIFGSMACDSSGGGTLTMETFIQMDGAGVNTFGKLLSAGINTSPAINEVTYDGSAYVLNGQDMIKRKTLYAISAGCMGVMSWDLANDVPFTNSLSLLSAVVEASQSEE